MTTATKTLSILGLIHEYPNGLTQPPVAYIYQRTAKGKGNLPGTTTRDMQRRRYVKPRNTLSFALVARRQWFALGVQAFHALTPTDKARWRDYGRQRQITAYNAFMAAWLHAFTMPAEPNYWDATFSIFDGSSALWDGGASTWDASATSWDATTPAAWDGGYTMWDPTEQSHWDSGTTTWIN